MSYYLSFGIYLAIVAMGFITGIVLYRKPDYKILPVIIILGYTTISQVGSVLAAKYFRNNVPNEHLSTLVATCLWGWFFYININEKKIKAIIKWQSVAFAVFCVINALFIQDINTFPDNTMKIATAFNLVWGSVLLIQLLDLPAKENVFRNSYFLVTIGLVWFNIISSFYFFLTAFLTKYDMFQMLVLDIHFYSNCVYYLILFIAMLFLKKYNQNVRRIRI